jgi:NAD(P)-dependent dehydrogenase (short-subunit alcohol dehydrogenase family)
MDKPICLITGATDGVGKATATELARNGFAVVLAARNEAKAVAVTTDITTATGNRDVDYLIGDLASLTQLRGLADTFTARYPRLDVLINNAGVFMPERIVTEDGYEATFQINYLSQFVLTHLMLDELRKSQQGRIINLSSSAYRAGKFDPENLQSEQRFSTFGSYTASKLMVLLFTQELAKRLGHTRITANAVHPGIVRTQMMLNPPGALFRAVSYLSLPLSVSPPKGASRSVYLARSPEVAAVSGRYFTRAKEKRVKSAFDTEENRELLWALSMNAVQWTQSI